MQERQPAGIHLEAAHQSHEALRDAEGRQKLRGHIH